MPQVTVFNPSNGPVTVDNARPIGGAERAVVELTPLVQDYIDRRVLILKQAKPKPVKAETKPAVDDGSDKVPPVSSVVEEAKDEPEVVAEETKPETASMKRRRKSPPVKE